VVVQGASLAEVQGKAASQTPPPIEARGKSPAAPDPGVGAPAPRVGDEAVSPGGWTDMSPCGVEGTPPGEKAKDIVSTRVRVELYDQQVNRKKSDTKICLRRLIT
jgi:hypothetical protein